MVIVEISSLFLFASCKFAGCISVRVSSWRSKLKEMFEVRASGIWNSLD